jgi:hypothetical protein
MQSGEPEESSEAAMRADEQAEAAQELSGEGEGTSEAAEEDAMSPFKDFKEIDKDKWNEILEELDPDDFKYKT